MPSEDDSDTEEHHAATWEHQSLAQVKIRVLRGHKDAVNSCSFTFDDSKILTASHDKTLRLWDASSGTHLKVYKGHTSFVTCCHTDPNSARIASGGWDKRLLVWDIQTGTILWEALNEGIVTSCHFSHDGRYLVNSSDLDFAVSVWDVREGSLIKKLFNHKSTVTCCRFAPMENRICTTSMDRTTKITDMRTFTDDYNVTLTLGGHINVISSCCFSKDEHLLATGSWDKNILIWDIATGVYRTQGPITFPKGHEGSVSACNFSEDGEETRFHKHTEKFCPLYD